MGKTARACEFVQAISGYSVTWHDNAMRSWLIESDILCSLPFVDPRRARIQKSSESVVSA